MPSTVLYLVATIVLAGVVVLVALWRDRPSREPLVVVRRLAALDLALHRPWLVLTEFAVTVVLGLGLAALSLRAGLTAHPMVVWQVALGAALAGIGCNYVPLLAHAIDLVRSGTARSEAAGELERPARYGMRQLLLAVPFAVAVLGIMQLRGPRP